MFISVAFSCLSQLFTVFIPAQVTVTLLTDVDINQQKVNRWINRFQGEHFPSACSGSWNHIQFLKTIYPELCTKDSLASI